MEGDVSCGILKPGAEASLVFPKPKNPPKTITVVWWTGDRNRPENSEFIYEQQVELREFDETKSRWNVFLELNADNSWTTKPAN